MTSSAAMPLEPGLGAQAELLDLLKLLVSEIEGGDQSRADELLDDVTRLRESVLFQQLGQITRHLHEALTGFDSDVRLSGLVAQHMPDARARLGFVISKTEESAHRTLAALETAVPAARAISERARRIRSLRHEEERGVMAPGEIDECLDAIARDCALVEAHLADVLLAQEFQDITGQTLRRVIDQVQEVDDELVNMLRGRARARGIERRELRPATPDANGSLLAEGPAMPDAEHVVTGQDDVDDLLSSLGF